MNYSIEVSYWNICSKKPLARSMFFSKKPYYSIDHLIDLYLFDIVTKFSCDFFNRLYIYYILKRCQGYIRIFDSDIYNSIYNIYIIYLSKFLVGHKNRSIDIIELTENISKKVVSIFDGGSILPYTKFFVGVGIKLSLPLNEETSIVSFNSTKGK